MESSRPASSVSAPLDVRPCYRSGYGGKEVGGTAVEEGEGHGPRKVRPNGFQLVLSLNGLSTDSQLTLN